MEHTEAGEGWSRSDWSVAAGIALLLALAPLATIAGARLIGSGARAEAEALQPRAMPLLTARRDAARGHALLRRLLQRPTLGARLDRLAASLPEPARLVRAESAADGALTLEVVSPDPDRLRAALRREPTLAGLRDFSQRQADGGMLVTLRSAAP